MAIPLAERRLGVRDNHDSSQYDSTTYGLPKEVVITALQNEGQEVIGFVPPEFIAPFDIPTDAARVDNLVESFQANSADEQTGGQLEPGLLLQVTDETGETKLELANGAHRFAAHERLGNFDYFYAIIKRDATPMDLVDHRMIATKPHRSVEFARIVKWVHDAWPSTEWSQRGISVGKAFSVGRIKNPTGGRRLGLTDGEINNMREWIRDKCDQWGQSPDKIFEYLRGAASSSPKLMDTLRIDARGGGVISRSHFKLITTSIREFG